VYNSLLAFKIQILRRIYGAVQTEDGWRKRNNGESEKLMGGEDIVKYVKAQRIKCWERFNKLEQNKNSEEDYGM
jgi:hypothetical protein